MPGKPFSPIIIDRSAGSTRPALITAPERRAGGTLIRVPDDLWGSWALPMGTLARWLVADSAHVVEGLAIAQINIGDTLHDIGACCDGTLVRYLAECSLIEPGTALGEIVPDRTAARRQPPAASGLFCQVVAGCQQEQSPCAR